MVYDKYDCDPAKHTSETATRKLAAVVFATAVLSLVAGILIGRYGIAHRSSSGTCDSKNPVKQADPVWPFIAHTRDQYDGQHVAKSAWKAIAIDNKSRLDAVVAGITSAEFDDTVGSVGSGTNPDESGETTQDAMIMDGETHVVGAVGCLRRVKNAIGVAKAVMDYSTHTLLVGDSATNFAFEMGFNETNLTIQAEIDIHAGWLNKSCQPNFRKNVVSKKDCGPYTPKKVSNSGGKIDNELPEDVHDTIGMIVIDKEGKMAVGTSTSGLRNKIPGRVGDSPIPGAGSYVDREVGACVATGNGDIMVRFLPCFHAVEELRRGKTADEAGELAIRRIQNTIGKYGGAVMVVTKDGHYGAGCSGNGKLEFVVQSGTMTEPEVVTKDCHVNPE